MAYVPADLDVVKKRVIALLNANPGTFNATVAANGAIGAFPSDAEILQAILEADSNIACQGYANSVNDSLANNFQVTSLPFADRDPVPFHHGDIAKLELSKSLNTFGAISVANQIPVTNHGLSTGDIVSFITTGTLPTGLSLTVTYYVIVINANVISVAVSMKNALAGVATGITQGTGSGTHTVINWQIGVEAKSVDDITNAQTGGMSAYVGAGSYDFLFKAADGQIYTCADFWRATHFEYTQTSVPQVSQNETSLLIFEACAILVKNASPALFQTYSAYAQNGIKELIQDGVLTSKVEMEANS